MIFIKIIFNIFSDTYFEKIFAFLRENKSKIKNGYACHWEKRKTSHCFLTNIFLNVQTIFFNLDISKIKGI